MTSGWAAWKSPRCGFSRRPNPEGVARRTRVLRDRTRSVMASAARSISSSSGRQLDRQRRRRQAVRAAGEQRAPPAPAPAPAAGGGWSSARRPAPRAAPDSEPGPERRQEIPQLIPVDVLRPGHGGILGHRPAGVAGRPRPALGALGESTPGARGGTLARARRTRPIRRQPSCTSSREFRDTPERPWPTRCWARASAVRVLVRHEAKGEPWRQRGAPRWPSPRWTTRRRWRPRCEARARRLPAVAPGSALGRSHRRRLAHRRRHRPGGDGQRPGPPGAAVGHPRGRRPGRRGCPARCERRRPVWREVPTAVTFVRAAFLLENWAAVSAGDGGGQAAHVPAARSASCRWWRRGTWARWRRRPCWRGRRQDRPARQILEVVGPREYCPDDVAAALASLLRRPVQAEAVPLEVLPAVLASAGASSGVRRAGGADVRGHRFAPAGAGRGGRAAVPGRHRSGAILRTADGT